MQAAVTLAVFHFALATHPAFVYNCAALHKVVRLFERRRVGPARVCISPGSIFVRQQMRGWREPVLGCGLVVQLTILVVVATLVPLGIGIFLDRLLHTSPLLTLFTMVLGISLGTLGVAREINGVYNRVAGGKK
jgi:Putative F0F1-ATPase subunit Ca2+/Mg2+ transporter